MKWLTNDKYPGCLFNQNNTILKTDSFDNIPNVIKQTTFCNGIIKDSCLITDITKGICQIVERKKITNEYIGIEFKNSNDSTIIDMSLIKPFMQKTSKYYLLGNNCPLLIQNKNYIVMIASVLPDYFIPVLEA